MVDMDPIFALLSLSFRFETESNKVVLRMGARLEIPFYVSREPYL